MFANSLDKLSQQFASAQGHLKMEQKRLSQTVQQCDLARRKFESGVAMLHQARSDIAAYQVDLDKERFLSVSWKSRVESAKREQQLALESLGAAREQYGIAEEAQRQVEQAYQMELQGISVRTQRNRKCDLLKSIAQAENQLDAIVFEISTLNEIYRDFLERKEKRTRMSCSRNELAAIVLSSPSQPADLNE